MKKTFTEPEVTVVSMACQDIICTSSTCGSGTNDTSVSGAFPIPW